MRRQYKDASMDHETKTLAFEIKELNEDEGTFTGYAATFSDEPDSYGDIIDKGAFKKTLKEGAKRIKILWNHYTMEPIGKPLEMSEDDHGLLVKGQLILSVQRAREVFDLMKAGVITELSIGYDTIKQKRDNGIRHLQEIKLWDFSPVTFAANDDALVTQVKAGRVLSAANMEKVKKGLSALQAGIESLQALVEAVEGEDESGKSTQLSEEVAEQAAKMQDIVSTLKAENEGFDTKEAEGRIEAILDKLKK